MKLVGFALWRGADGETYVTFLLLAPSGWAPSAASSTTCARLEGQAADPRAGFKAWILESWLTRSVAA